MTKINISEEISILTANGYLQLRYISGFNKSGVVISHSWENNPVHVRIQSSCLFSESFGAIDCDCSDQLHSAIREIKFMEV